MLERSSVRARLGATMLAMVMATAAADAATISVPAGGNLQAALNAAAPGDTILLAPGATYEGNFKLPVHGGTEYITLRSAAPDHLLPAPGKRMSPAYSPHLARIKSPNSAPAIATAPAAAYWRLQLLEFGPNKDGMYDIVVLGDGGRRQNVLSLVPHTLILDRLYIHGDPLHGQKRGIALNSANTTIINSYISDIKTLGQDGQAIGGWNGPGPFRIENNYLEASAEGMLLGGADPSIPNLVPSDIIFRRNVVSRPVSWRDPIVPTPLGVRAAAGSDGSLSAGTYAYRVVARRKVSTSMARSLPSTEVSVTVVAGSRVLVEWSPVPDATEYYLYAGAPGAQNRYWRVTSTSFVDDGATPAMAGTPSASASQWQVKNLFELKNARRVLIAHNVLENNWAQAQNGIAVLFTPRNSNDSCTWCVVEQVTFEYNRVRHAGGGVNILGADYTAPTAQTNNITIRHNEFTDISRTWGGLGYIFTITEQPRDIVIDHNTFISNGSGVVIVDGPPIYGFEFTNNVAAHNKYGLFGSGIGTGNSALAAYFPGATFTRNVLAGGKATSYPAGNEFPTLLQFEAHFTDYAGGDYSLKPGTDWAGAGTDGLDLGADMAGLLATVSENEASPHVETTALPAATEGEFFSATLGVRGGRAPYTWRLMSGALPPGVALDPSGGVVAGAPVLPGGYTFTVQVQDARGMTAVQPLALDVARGIPPVEIVSVGVPDATATLPYAALLDARGGLGSFVWMLTTGALPSGLTLRPDGTLSGASSTAGTFAFAVTALDATDHTRSATANFTVTVLPPPNVPPAVSLVADQAGPAPVGSTVTLTAIAGDTDGTVQRVEFYVDDRLIGSRTANPWTMSWLVSSAGPHRFSVRAVDDDGAATVSEPLMMAVTSEVVLTSNDVTRIVGNFQIVADRTAAAGARVANPNLGVVKVNAPSAAPASFVEMTFFAEAGRPYRLWIRGRAERNNWNNDSVFLQFDGIAAARLGTTRGWVLTLEDSVGAGLSGWGWQDHAFGSMAAPVVFERTGTQTLRIIPREDGLSIDQVVLSPDTFFHAAPGTVKNDRTVLR